MKTNLSFHDHELDNNTENIGVEEIKQESAPSGVEIPRLEKGFAYVPVEGTQKKGS